MRLAELIFYVMLAWGGPVPPPVFLDKGARANLRTEGPPNLLGILGFMVLVVLVVLIAYSYVRGPFWWTIIAVILFISTVVLICWRSLQT